MSLASSSNGNVFQAASANIPSCSQSLCSELNLTIEAGSNYGQANGGNIVLSVAPPASSDYVPNFIHSLTNAYSVYEDGTFLWWGGKWSSRQGYYKRSVCN